MKLKINENRPKNFEEFVGQSNIVENLKVYIHSAKVRKQRLDHMLFNGNSGLGKTSLAYLIANEIKSNILVLNGTSLQRASDIISPLTSLKDGDILFIDEIHAMSKEVFEVLYPVLEDNSLNVIVGKEYNSKVVNINLANFTFIGATTEINKLSEPFINRFPINFLFQSYTNNEIAKILKLNSIKMNIDLKDEVIEFLSTHCKNNPRISINILKRIYDYIIFNNPLVIDIDYIKRVLVTLNIFQFGLNKRDIEYLKLLKDNNFIGIETLKQMLNVSISVILNHIEPTLLNEKLILKTLKGRTLTKKGLEYLSQLTI
ncbi:Holliday junction DNA helicase RuvB [Spiroplasma chinense]|uniref:Holliday junction branch migration complex subunit RuvB n=1 Tax=Spiroplasma chinense TaxID=216932 RepID=A0A5B9Y468_9MOLU|nr:Holliday junction branch migration DNA helicase RuvB [Spiroplasma chinense]QEH61831.1 Holliday junction DNA helicase RuvB [Spiroplasma chinense]